MGPPWALVGWALVGPLVPYGPGPYVPPGPVWPGPLWAPCAFMGRALMGTQVNQRLAAMAIPLNLLATLKWHKAIYIYI